MILQQQYELEEPSAKPILYIYIVLLTVTIIMTILLYQRWKERKQPANKLIFFTFTGFHLAIFVLLLGFIQMSITGDKEALYMFSLAFGYTAMALTNIILMYFAAEVFGVKKNYLYKYVILSLITAVLLALPENYYGVKTSIVATKTDNIRPITSVLLFLFQL